jgi:hypothetical protein
MCGGGNQSGAVAAGSLKDSAIVLDEPVPLAPRSKIAPIIRTRKACDIAFEPTRDGLRLQAIPGAMMCLGRIATRWSAQAQLQRLFDTLDVFSQL